MTIDGNDAAATSPTGSAVRGPRGPLLAVIGSLNGSSAGGWVGYARLMEVTGYVVGSR